MSAQDVEVGLDDIGVSAEVVVERILRDRPAFHQGGQLRWDSLPETLRFIAKSARSGYRTLETGCGVSTVVFAASGAEHTAISPDVGEHLRVRDYCSTIDVALGHVDLIPGLSGDVLPRLPVERVLDMVFIDGAHAFPYPVVDWYYITRVMKVGGTLILDDVPIPSIAMLYRFMMTEGCWRQESILDERTAVFTLVSVPPAEDWTTQRFNKRLDFSFLPGRKRVSAVAVYRYGLARTAVGRRFPFLRALRRRPSE